MSTYKTKQIAEQEELGVFKQRLLWRVFIVKVMCWYYFYFIISCHRCSPAFTFLKRENQNTCIEIKKVTFMKMNTISFWVKIK